MRLLWLSLAWVCVAAPLFAQSDPIASARHASEMLDAAAGSLEQARRSSDRVTALTQTVRAYEEGLSALREGLRRAAIRERTIQLTFEAKRDRLTRLLGALQTMGKSPAPLLMIHPTGPIGTARSGMILSEVTPALLSEVETLKSQLEEIALLQALNENAATSLVTALSDVQSARVELSKAVAERVDLPKAFAEDADQMRALLENSDTLNSFAEGLASLDLPDSQNTAKFTEAKGTLPLPAPGTILHTFNEPDAADVARPGWLWATRAQTLVTAPWPSTIRYHGPLLRYGNVVILEPEQGYLLILAGLGQTFGKVGDIVNKGDPVGLMGGIPPNADAFLINASKGGGGNRQESLYIELRENGAPVDPGAWFTENRE